MLGFVGIWGFRLQYVFYNHLWSRFVSFFALFVFCRKRNWFVKVHWVWFVKVHWVWFVNFICIGSRFVSFLFCLLIYMQWGPDLYHFLLCLLSAENLIGLFCLYALGLVYMHWVPCGLFCLHLIYAVGSQCTIFLQLILEHYWVLI